MENLLEVGGKKQTSDRTGVDRNEYDVDHEDPGTRPDSDEEMRMKIRRKSSDVLEDDVEKQSSDHDGMVTVDTQGQSSDVVLDTVLDEVTLPGMTKCNDVLHPTTSFQNMTHFDNTACSMHEKLNGMLDSIGNVATLDYTVPCPQLGSYKNKVDTIVPYDHCFFLKEVKPLLLLDEGKRKIASTLDRITRDCPWLDSSNDRKHKMKSNFEFKCSSLTSPNTWNTEPDPADRKKQSQVLQQQLATLKQINESSNVLNHVARQTLEEELVELGEEELKRSNIVFTERGMTLLEPKVDYGRASISQVSSHNRECALDGLMVPNQSNGRMLTKQNNKSAEVKHEDDIQRAVSATKCRCGSRRSTASSNISTRKLSVIEEEHSVDPNFHWKSNESQSSTRVRKSSRSLNQSRNQREKSRAQNQESRLSAIDDSKSEMTEEPLRTSNQLRRSTRKSKSRPSRKEKNQSLKSHKNVDIPRAVSAIKCQCGSRRVITGRCSGCNQQTIGCLKCGRRLLQCDCADSDEITLSERNTTQDIAIKMLDESTSISPPLPKRRTRRMLKHYRREPETKPEQINELTVKQMKRRYYFKYHGY